MKSYVWYVCLCAILTFLASPAMLADTYEVLDGGGWASGNASGGGWGGSCSSSASADGSYPSSQANYWASMDCYTDEAGYFFVNWDLDGNGEASYTDFDGSGASGTGAGGGSGYGLSTSGGVSLSSSGPGNDWDDSDNPGIHGGTTTAEWFDAFSSVGASSDSVAAASVGGSANWAYGSGNGSATVTLSN